MVRLRIATVLLVAAIVARARPARAAIESDLVKQGVAAYNDLEYPRAVDLLHKALQETLTRDEKIVTFQTLAFAHVALGKHDEAVGDFENLLRINGLFELDRTISPRVRSVFEEARGKVAMQGTGGGDSGRALPELRPTVPVRVKEGQAVTIESQYPGGVASSVELFYRTRGADIFGKLKAPVGAGGGFSVIVPGMHVAAPALEYYLVVLDENGASVALAGTLGAPLAVDVVGRKKPVYVKGWFWGVLAGVAVVGAGVATAVVLTTHSNISASTPATISIQPH
jgi:tetratricopeptide (TPR) repeat protein